jgi:methylenetetrahydrofolate dehydrogenase (NADP+)/methenyltetrahydrofolate cyclohydrolase
MNIVEPKRTAASFRELVKTEIAEDHLTINIIGFLVPGDPASEIYANYTMTGCEDVGIQFELVKTDRDSIRPLLAEANADPSVHGIFIYYPVFADDRDPTIRELVSPRKDVEGLTSYWMNKLYANERFEDAAGTHKAILPCTPLAIIKLLEVTEAYTPVGLPFSGQTITIFNRSEVVGRPLAYMLSHDGGRVYSFDINGGLIIDADGRAKTPISRERALEESDIVITGVPSRSFEKVRAKELKRGVICLNFSSVQNFAEDAKEMASCYIPRVGPLTVAMCLRNALRLYRNYHQGKRGEIAR